MKVQGNRFWKTPWGKSALGMGCVLPLLTACGGGGDAAVVPPVVPPVTTSPLEVNTPFALSDFDSGDKPKIQRAGDGTLVVAYGDAPDNARLVYDVKAQVERPARDIFVKSCKPDPAAVPAKTCDLLTDWSTATNVSQSSAQSSINTEWRGTLAPGQLPFPGDIDKPNIKTSGPVMVLTWVSKYCPDGDLTTVGVQAPVQRAIRYLERDSRIIPFSCTWVARSINNGVAWSPAVQLSTGERDAIQDSSSGGFNTETRLGQVNISWQEDPQGLQLGEADGPGDGASGANAGKGTDIWYTSATVNLAVPATPADDFVLATPVRLTDNSTGFGLSGSVNPIFDGAGVNVDPDLIEKGQAGASRANIGMVGGTAIVAYEETKGSEGLDEGKFVRYHTFPFATPPATPEGKAGCVISNPLKNARRVRFLTQSPTDAGTGGIQIAIFWKEGIYDKGGPSDIVVRRGMGGLQASSMVPSVDAACATSDYTTAIGLSNLPGENISSRAPSLTVADNGLADGTETNFTENALAHRGVLRGGDLWIGYNYTPDLVRLWAQLDNYNFWLRKYSFAGGSGSWDLPKNVTNITDKRINVREPRIFGTPKSSATACPTGLPGDPTTTDATLCQNTNVIYLAWGTQENVSPFVPEGGSDLGIYITASIDGAQSLATPVRYSVAAGPLFQDDESAYESQVVTRPDGGRFYGVWNQADASVEVVPGVPRTVAEYASGSITSIVSP
ncbi:MAG: choice-of-anchor O protein [Hydrogenophaga sp.]|uniref:choice-of-anchor O protein n=1 Tax=Hydrogenophaga sp. TaxID=1904254 RepID=UPI002634595D|nr:choice-of-anchor O protein [Hydrogenophaga sp.]MDM7944583.1 choice-of-anchor O protein [Hydrogenophaga sp.]